MRVFRRLSCLFAIVIALLSLMFLCIACEGGKTEHHVVFIVDDDVYDEEKAVVSQEMELPEEPTKEGYIFQGWYRDKGVWEDKVDEQFTVNNLLTADVDVYAYFVHDHQEEDWYILSSVSATEDEEGEIVFACSVCGVRRKEILNKVAHVHIYGDWNANATNHWKQCNKDGVQNYFAEHTFVETLSKAPSEEEVGEMTFTCSVCGYERTETVEKLPHTHTFGEWQHDETNHWKECAKDEVKDGLAEHTFTEETTKEPTEDEEGEKTYTCSVCGYSKTETIDRLPHVHVFGDWQHDETNHWKECSKDEVKDGLAEHTFDEEITKDATEDEEGEKTLTCSVCGYSKTETIDRLPHVHVFGDWQHDETNHWKECAKDGEKDELAEHTFNEEITKEATEDEDGEKTFTCTVCGYSKKETIDRLPHVHVFGDWQHDETNHWKECAKDQVKDGLAEHTFDEEITKEATELEDGEKTFTCTVCGFTKTESYHLTVLHTATFRANGETVRTVEFTVHDETIEEPAVPARAGYTGVWEAYTLGTNDITINAVYTAIEYTATFVAGDTTVDTVNFTVETASVAEPTVPERTGYNGAWEDYTLGTNNITINAVYTAIVYTATFKADGVTVDTALFTIVTEYITEPTVPVKAGYTGQWENYTLGTSDITVNAVYTAIEYSATFVAGNETVSVIPFTMETTNTVVAPGVPAKQGYNGAWEAYTLSASDATIHAVYTLIEYTATFVANNETVGTVNFTVETVSITEPTVPAKTGYTGEWEEYELGTANITINAVYTAIQYTATFVADNVTIGTVNFTVETVSIEEPQVPEKSGFTGEWETYSLGANNITIHAVYTENAVEPEPEQSVFTMTGSEGAYTITGVTDNTITSAVIPSGVVAVADGAFANCSLLTSVTIPTSVTSFGEGAFTGCTALTAVYYAGSVEDWCGISFGGNSTENANPLVFAHDLYVNGDEQVTTLTIPGTVTTINPHAFEGCSCTEVVLSDGVETIGRYAFKNCGSMTKFTFSATVTSIPNNMFGGCENLSTIKYNGTPDEWEENVTKGANWIGNAQATYVKCKGGNAEIV